MVHSPVNCSVKLHTSHLANWNATQFAANVSRQAQTCTDMQYTVYIIHNICLSRQTFILATSLYLSLSLSTTLSLLLNNFISLVIGSATATARAKALSGLVKEPTTTRTATTSCIERQLSRSVLLGIGQARSLCRGSKRCQVASRMKSENNFYYYCWPPPPLSVMCSMCPSLSPSLCRCNASLLLSFRPFSPTAPRRRVVCLPFPSLATLP